MPGSVWEWDFRQVSDLVKADGQGFVTAIYFSFVTALSIGYGDVVPLGLFRIVAIVEGAAGLLIFGCVISKLVSRRQEELTEEIHQHDLSKTGSIGCGPICI